MKGFQVAIDGPVGSGKSTVARLVAKKLGFIYVDTGAMYRCVALFAIRKGVDVKDEEIVCSLLDKIDLAIVGGNDGKQLVKLDGVDVSEEIREEKVSMGASIVAKFKSVRDKLVDLQRKMAGCNKVIMDGRDIGTYVLPNARVKIYLDASPEIRAKRRFLEIKRKGGIADFDTVAKELALRDKEDMNRKESPLKIADNAILIDTGELDTETVIEKIVEIIERCGGLD